MEERDGRRMTGKERRRGEKGKRERKREGEKEGETEEGRKRIETLRHLRPGERSGVAMYLCE